MAAASRMSSTRYAGCLANHARLSCAANQCRMSFLTAPARARPPAAQASSWCLRTTGTANAVKRVLTRDGASRYVMNQQSVRRRDVQDILLGTGLGPRAYAMIGKGMIARLIEAKPEELRIFLEEAAGVSKYKERRRETENRLSDARENLT